MKNYRISDLAADDLVEIWYYISQDDPAAADRMMKRFEAAFMKLGDYPRMGRGRSRREDDFRVFTVGDYLIFYRMRDNYVDILRVLSGFLDLNDLILESE